MLLKRLCTIFLCSILLCVLSRWISRLSKGLMYHMSKSCTSVCTQQMVFQAVWRANGPCVWVLNFCLYSTDGFPDWWRVNGIYLHIWLRDTLRDIIYLSEKTSISCHLIFCSLLRKVSSIELQFVKILDTLAVFKRAKLKQKIYQFWKDTLTSRIE
jgi:hypothetical protein